MNALPWLLLGLLHAGPVATSSLPKSQAIRALAEPPAAVRAARLPQFWQGIAEHGTPIIEPVANDPAHRWVTFVFRDRPGLRRVTVHASLDGPREGTGDLEHLAGTDLWYRTYRVEADARLTYTFGLNAPPPLEDAWPDPSGEVPDPLNPRRYVIPKDDEDPTDKDAVSSLLELPAAPADVWSAARGDVPAGKVSVERFKSTALANERRVWVYQSPGAPTNGPRDLLIFFDDGLYLNPIPTPTILDNLVAARRQPPTVALFVDSLGDARNRELTCNPAFNRFLVEELLPWARHRYHLGKDPRRVTLVGSSYGGLAAAFAALEHPEAFGNVLSQSGSYWWRPEAATEAEWLTQRLAHAPSRPVRFEVTVGRYETGPIPGKPPNQLVVNRHLRDVLVAKGYPVTYAEVAGAHQYVSWGQSLADSLLRLHSSATSR